MISPPDYFESIRQAAEKRWNQLEADPELAGPWHQLFMQVQSPRHVLSELLQNADDAGATETTVRIEKGTFIFIHNGEDFTRDHFASLCRFGYSNKRALHTIGFRGIGFKSLFSLGESVELFTPTLAVAFVQKRFTEPRWLPDSCYSDADTVIQVGIRDEQRELEIKKNLDEWMTSPLSLLFFRNIRKITIGDRIATWESFGPGPVADSAWMALNGNADDEFLLVRSKNEAFPLEALAEIRQERLLSGEQPTDFPPCSIDIVLGAKGRLYVVLPTGVDTALPFACNAPFIQDPARLKIKEPEISFTNRWLLERAGRLAAEVMLRWVGRKESSLAERSQSYCLMPDVDRSEQTLDGMCATIVESAFEAGLSAAPFLLTGEGDLRMADEIVIIPDELLDVWPESQVAALLDERNRPALSRHVSESDRKKLVNWNVVERVGSRDLLKILQTQRLPRPGSWGQLLALWAYIEPEITGYRCSVDPATLGIVPVQGKDVLHPAREVTRLGEKRLLASEEDWDFLAAHLLVLNQNWPRYLAEQRRSSDGSSPTNTAEKAARALSVLAAVGLGDTGDVSRVIDQVAADFFATQPALGDCVRLAQIAAKLGVTPGRSFRFATQNRSLRSTEHGVSYDVDGTLAAILPVAWCALNLLHPDYWAGFVACTAKEWFDWLSSGRSGLLGFAPISKRWYSVWSRSKVKDEVHLRSRGGDAGFPYESSSFSVDDWDFEEDLWSHWESLAESERNLWARVCEQILKQPGSFWSHALRANIFQTARNGNSRAILSAPLLPKWILRLGELPCLPDTRGVLYRPSDLLLRTPETEPFIDVEPFIHGRLDSERTRPLLELLGVRNTAAGPDRLLNCLRALAKAEEPPLHEVDKWYRRLDQMIDTCSTVDLVNIKNTFSQERLILSGSGEWTTASGVFFSADDEGLPGAEVIRASVKELALWRKLSVADRPTANLIIQWLQQLPSGAVLSKSDAKRVRAMLPHHPVRIWKECSHWLNLAGEWVPTITLKYTLTMQSPAPWSHLHQWVKKEVADMQLLPPEITQAPPFSNLPTLSASIEERLHQNPTASRPPCTRPWLSALGSYLERINLDEEVETTYIRARGAELKATMWQSAQDLEVVPYIRGIPAGTPRRAKAVWMKSKLYAQDGPLPTIAPAIALELERAFRRQDIAMAIKFCFDRTPEFVAEYMAANFKFKPNEPERILHDERATSTVPSKDSADEHSGSSSATAGFTQCLSGMTSQAVEPLSANETDDDGLGIVGDANRRGRQAKPERPTILERYARIHGFRKSEAGGFLRSDGSWIDRPHGSRFWERRDAKGKLIQYYYPRDHCLESEPLMIDADVWNLLEKFPDTHSLILSDVEGSPMEWKGHRLQAMRDGGDIKLHPAAYRLSCTDSHQTARLPRPPQQTDSRDHG